LRVEWAEVEWADRWSRSLVESIVLVLLVVVIVVVSTLVVGSGLLWHWRKGYTFWKIWKWVNQASLLLIVVEEGAVITEWTFSIFDHVFAWFSLEVRVDCTKSSFAEVLWKSVIWLSQFSVSVSKLAVLLKWAGFMVHVVLA
jgi:hypothetical protein